jgi:hypothetical protein
VVVLKYMTVSEEGKHVGCGIEEQSDPSIHNRSTSCPLDFGLQFGRFGALNILISSILGHLLA